MGRLERKVAAALIRLAREVMSAETVRVKVGPPNAKEVVTAYPLELDGIRAFVFKENAPAYQRWKVHEWSSSKSLGYGPTRAEAIAAARARIKEHGIAVVKALIKKSPVVNQ